MKRVRNLLLMFVFFAVTGWIYEVLYTLGAWGIFENRGFLFGPWLPLYGFGGMMIYGSLRPLLRAPIPSPKCDLRLPLVFVLVCLMTTAVELGASYLLDAVGMDFRYLWDYSERMWNFEGRISLSASLWFGVLGIVIIYLVMPLYRRLIGIRNENILHAIAWPVIVVFLVDVVARIPLGSNFTA